jgi:histone deacetylase 6
VAVAETLLGRPPPPINSLSVSEYGTETVWLVANEQSSFWKSIDVDSCEPGPGMRHATRLFSHLVDCAQGSRVQPLNLAGIALDYFVILLLIVSTEQLKMHRQAFIHSEGGLSSLPLLPDVSRFFEGQVASTLAFSHILLYVPDRPLVRTLKKMMLSFSSCTSCKLKSHLHTPSH